LNPLKPSNEPASEVPAAIISNHTILLKRTKEEGSRGEERGGRTGKEKKKERRKQRGVEREGERERESEREREKEKREEHFHTYIGREREGEGYL
jgi:hypothetical protein